jgi:glycyl-tRNA synthetase
VDFDSLKAPHTVTVRERDTTLQVRMPLEDVTRVLYDLSTGKMTWEAVMATYPKFTQQETTTKAA